MDEVSKETTKKKFNNRRPRRTNEETKLVSGVGWIKQRVPGNMGITVPSFLPYSAADEDAYVPFGMVFGHYLPVGQDSNEYYPRIANQYLNRVQLSLRNRGFRTTYTVDQLRTYFNGASELLQLQRFISHLNGLQKVSAISNSPVVSLVVSQAINGRVLQAHRMLTKTLSPLPYPNKWVSVYEGSFGITSLSDNPNSGIRMFAPKGLQIDVTGETPVFDPNVIADYIEDRVANFFDDQTNRELSTSLDGSMGELSLATSSPVQFRGNVINNLLNLPYFDGTTNDPNSNDVTLTPIFFRRKLESGGCLTFAPDSSVVVTPQGTVWAQNLGVESTVTLVAFNNAGEALNAMTDQNVFSCFGTMWEASLGLNAGNAPSITRVNATFEGVADGVAEVMF